MRIVRKDEMAEIERQTYQEFAFSEELIIENVGLKGCQVIHNFFSENEIDPQIVVLVGKGNNGADGLAVARHLVNHGYRVRAFCFQGPEEMGKQGQRQLVMAKNFGVKHTIIKSVEEVGSYFDSAAPVVLIDALYGTGVRLPISNFLSEVVDICNESAELIFSIDIPSGVEGDTGNIQGNAIDADYTLTISFPKVCHYVSDGSRLSGEIIIIDAGIPKIFHNSGNKFLLTTDHALDTTKMRNKYADKRSFGHTLVLGGSHGLTGALTLASQAALKIGAGLVTGATWERQYQDFLSRLIPDIMTGYIPMETKMWDKIVDTLDQYDAVVVGPGLGRSTRARRLVLELLSQYNGPLVIDADGINVLNLKEDIKYFTLRQSPTILTPHFGEFSRFTRVELDHITQKPVEYLQKLIDQINCTVVLKGPCTYLGFPSGNVYFNYFPNDGMATGGVGDVLAGLLGGLLGQNKTFKTRLNQVDEQSAFDETVGLAVLVHSMAGKIAAEKFGARSMTASSLITCLTPAFTNIEKMFMADSE